MHRTTRRLDRLEQTLGASTEADAADGEAAHATLITKLDTLTERLADPDAQPQSQMERIAWLMSRDSAGAMEQLHTLLAERYGQ